MGFKVVVVAGHNFATPWTVDCQAPLSMGFHKQEHWSELPFPSPGDLADSGIEPTSPALAGGFFLPLRFSGKPLNLKYLNVKTKAETSIEVLLCLQYNFRYHIGTGTFGSRYSFIK